MDKIKTDYIRREQVIMPILDKMENYRKKCEDHLENMTSWNIKSSFELSFQKETGKGKR